MSKIKAAIFDIDGTVTPEISWLSMTRDMGGSVDEHKKIFGGFLDNTISYEDSRKMLTGLWKETGNATEENLKKIFQSWSIFQEAYNLVSFLREKGVIVVFITGSVGIYAEIMARKFSVDKYYANAELLFDAERNLTDFIYPLDPSSEKLKYFHHFCQESGLKPEEIIAIGDSDNDVGIFSKTQRGIMVGDYRPEVLRKVAWKEADNISEVKDILVPFL